MGYYINSQIGYYEGDPISPDDTEVTQRPSDSLTVSGVTVAAPAGVTVNLPDQSLTVTYTWDGSAWIADLAALRTARLGLIRAHRDVLLAISDRSAKDSVALDSPDRTLAAQVGAWTIKLRNVPDVAATALDALTDAAAIAAFEPDYTVPARVIVLTIRQFMAALALSGFITEAEAIDRTTIPAAIDAIFAALPTTPVNQQTIARVTWASMTVIARNDPLVAASTGAFGQTEAQIDAFFEMAVTL